MVSTQQLYYHFLMERIPYRKTYEIVGYAYEAELHCIPCTLRRFGDAVGFTGDEEINPAYPLIDGEGSPVYPLMLEEVQEDDACGDCRRRLNE
jgi:hypothetical protein